MSEEESVAPTFIGGEEIVGNTCLPVGRNADASFYCEALINRSVIE